MYGTVCRFQLRSGMEPQLIALTQEEDTIGIPGIRAQYVYRLDHNPDEYLMAVVFESEEAYKRNAVSPEQDARYRQFRDLLVADPEWHDGEIIYATTDSPAR